MITADDALKKSRFKIDDYVTVSWKGVTRTGHITRVCGDTYMDYSDLSRPIQKWKYHYDIKTDDNPLNQNELLCYIDECNITAADTSLVKYKFNAGDEVIVKDSYFVRCYECSLYNVGSIGKITGRFSIGLKPNYHVMLYKCPSDSVPKFIDVREEELIESEEKTIVFNLNPKTDSVCDMINKIVKERLMNGKSLLSLKSSIIQDETYAISKTDYTKAIEAWKNFAEKERNGKSMSIINAVNKYENYFNIDKVIFNDPATIIYWASWHYENEKDKDGNDVLDENGKVKKIHVQDKTVVKCAPGEPFSKYNGFCAAVAKRLFGTNSMVSRIVSEAQDDSKKDIKKKTKKEVKKILTSNDDTCPYYISKEGRKYTCKQVYNCDGVKKDKCIEYQKQTSKKSKGGKKK